MQKKSRSRLIAVATTCALVSVLVPIWANALQQRVEAVDYGLSSTEIQTLIRTASPNAILLTGTDINAHEPPLDDQAAQYTRLLNYHNAGYKVLGYVSTHDGSGQPELNLCRTVDCINHYVDEWYTMYGAGRPDRMSAVDGIMFDEGTGLANFPDRAAFYQQIYQHAKSLGFTVFLNVAVPLQESQRDLVLGGNTTMVADIIQFYEAPCTQYLSSYEYPRWPTWWWDVPSTMKAETITECSANPPEAPQWRDAVYHSKLYGTGYFFTFDGTSAAYNHLPPYWEDLVRLIQDSSPLPANQLRQYFYGDAVYTYIWSVLQQSASVGVGNLTLNLTPNPNVGSAIARVTTQSAFNLVNSSVSVRMNQVVNNGTVNNKMAILSTSTDFNNGLYWGYEGGNLYAHYYLNGTRYQINGLNGVPYSSTGHAWLRIRESAGTVYWETSADGTSWVVQGSVATNALFALNTVYVVLDAQTWGPMANPGQARYSRLNTGP